MGEPSTLKEQRQELERLLEEAKSKALSYDGGLHYSYLPVIGSAETVEDVQRILAGIIGMAAASEIITVEDVEMSEEIYVSADTDFGVGDPNDDVHTLVQAVLDDPNIDIDESDIAGIYMTVDNPADAIQVILAAIDPEDITSQEALQDIAPELLLDATEGHGIYIGFIGDPADENYKAGKNHLSLVYDGEFLDNHDELIELGWGVSFADGEIYYIEPQTRRAMNLEREDVGVYEDLYSRIDFLDHDPDPRKPIGMGTGTFAPEGTGINTVAGKPTVSLKEWHELYGDDLFGGPEGFEDAVTRKTFEDILREDLNVGSHLIGVLQNSMIPIAALISSYTTYEVPLHYQYLEGMATNMLIDQSAEDTAALQKRYSDLGVYKIGTLGLIDPLLIGAVNTTMAAANHNHPGDPEGFNPALSDFEASQEYTYNWFGNRPRASGGGGGGGGVSRVWRPPAYLAPDYAELSQAVKATFEQKLGRAPSDAEIKMLSVKMGADHRGEFDAQSAAQKLQFFASGGTSAGTVQDVNYASRFQEDFGDKYKDELGTLDKVEMSRGISQAALGSILTADRAIGY